MSATNAPDSLPREPLSSLLSNGASRRGLLTVGALAGLAAAGIGDADDAMAASTGLPATIAVATDFGATGDGRTDDTAALQRWLDSGKVEGYLPPGDYIITGTLTQSQMDVRMSPRAKLIAGGPINGPMWTTPTNLNGPSDFASRSLRGGQFVAGGLAKGGIHLYQFSRFTLTDVFVSDALEYGVKVGSRDGKAHTSYEAFIQNVHMATWNIPFDAARIGLAFENATDSEVRDMVINSVGIGVWSRNSSNNFSNIHVWGNDPKHPEIGFKDSARGNAWIACSADTVSKYGFHLESDSTRLIACRVFQSSYHTIADNQVTGIWVEQPGARITVVGCVFQGYSDANGYRRLAADIGGPGVAGGLLGGGSSFFGNITMVVTAPLLTGLASIENTKTSGLTANTVSTGSLQAKSTADATTRVNVRTDGTASRVELLNGTQLITWRGNYAAQTTQINGETGAIQPGTAAGLGSAIYSGRGAPTISGNPSDLYIRTDGAAGSWIYMGKGGTTWTPLL